MENKSYILMEKFCKECGKHLDSFKTEDIEEFDDADVEDFMGDEEDRWCEKCCSKCRFCGRENIEMISWKGDIECVKCNKVNLISNCVHDMNDETRGILVNCRYIFGEDLETLDTYDEHYRDRLNDIVDHRSNINKLMISLYELLDE